MLELNEDKSENYEIKYVNSIDLRPYEEYKKYIDEILKDYNIFEKRPVNNRQNEFINYDYCDIQERLKNFCSITFKDDEIFNGARNFFN